MRRSRKRPWGAGLRWADGRTEPIAVEGPEMGTEGQLVLLVLDGNALS